MRNTVQKSLGLVAALVLVLSLPALAGAQNPNFAGNWALNQAESNLGTPPAGGGGGGQRMGGGAAATLSIKHDATKLTITTQRTGRDGTVTDVVMEYVTDGKPVTTESQRGGPTTTTATWTSGKLVVVAKSTFSMGGGEPVERTTTTTYSLANGKLVVETVRPGMQGGAAMTTKAVYDKK